MAANVWSGEGVDVLDVLEHAKFLRLDLVVVGLVVVGRVR